MKPKGFQIFFEELLQMVDLKRRLLANDIQ